MYATRSSRVRDLMFCDEQHQRRVTAQHHLLLVVSKCWSGGSD